MPSPRFARIGLACDAVAAALALCLALAPLPATAAENDNDFSATVHVDASADNPEKARERARLDGGRRALAAVVERLSGGAAAPQLAKLDDRAITGMIDSFEVADEHMSAVRYLADYTFHFKPSLVRPLLRGAAAAAGGESAAPGAARPGGGGARLLLPVFRDRGESVLWSDPQPNPWRAAWAQTSEAIAPGRLELPLGDIDDLTAIDARRAETGDAAALAAIAERNGAQEVVVALAAARRVEGRLGGLDVALRRYRAGRLVDSRTKSFDADPGESETALLRRAAAAVAADVEPGAGDLGAAAATQAATLAAVVPITGLDDWIALRERLRGVAGIRGFDLLSLSRSEAKVAIHYVGDPDTLKTSLRASHLALAGGEPVWRLERADATPRPQ